MQGQYIDVDGIRTYYIDRGEGPTLVLLHGAAIAVDAHLSWFRTIEGLEDEYRLIAFDQIGFGRTDMPADGVYKDRLVRVDHAQAFLNRLGVRDATLIGHSEGAFIATRLAIVQPELAAKIVIVTSGGTAPYLGGEADAAWIAAAKAAYNDPSRFDSADAYVRASGHLSRVADERFEKILRENYQLALDSGQAELFRNIPKTDTDYRAYERLQQDHIFPYLADFDKPTLLVWAEEDQTVPIARGLKLMERIANAEFHVFRGAAHNVMHDQADGFNRLLRGWCKSRDG